MHDHSAGESAYRYAQRVSSSGASSRDGDVGGDGAAGIAAEGAGLSGRLRLNGYRVRCTAGVGVREGLRVVGGKC